MSLLLDRWNNEIKKKINNANQNSSNKNGVGASLPTTNNTTNSNKWVNTTFYKPETTNSTSSGSSSSGSSSSSSSSNKNSQYTGSSNAVVVNNSLQQAYKDEMNANSIAWHSADEAEKRQLEARNKELAALLGGTVPDSFDPVTGTWSGVAGGIIQEDMLDWNDNYDRKNSKEEYNSKYDPQIEALLIDILNRDDFSYNAMNDPLYQQYAKMYQREGDRAMRETLAEAAAGAGGMNTYAITAAQQANNYYNSQLNDRIPELYQLAYNMYLNDKESKVQDLGILQNMDATQYNRYRDTINDWYNDKSFAYGAYQDAVQQGNWQTTFDNNNYWANKEFDYNDLWANKEWNAKQEDKEYERNLYDQEKAYAQILDWIDKGVTSFSDEDLAKANLTQEEVNLLITAAQAQDASKKKIVNESVIEPDDMSDYSITNGHGESWVAVKGLGIGPVSDDLLEKLAKAGAIVGDENGNLYWADGWNSTNYQKRLGEMGGWSNLLTLPMR